MEYVGADERIKLKHDLNQEDGRAQDRENWLAVLDTVMNIQIQ